MDIRGELGRVVAAAIASSFGGAVSPEDAAAASVIETPRDSAHGDLATAAALRLAKPLRKAPRAIADELAAAVKPAADAAFPGYIERIEVVHPGFINFHLGMPYLVSFVEAAARGGYGRAAARRGTRVNLEFVSANPTGPLTVAHGRQAAVGDALANIMEYGGYEVWREYYVNDTGRQIRLLGASVLHFYAALAGGAFPFPEDGYHGDYIPGLARELFEREGAALLALAEDEALVRAGGFAGERIMEGIRADLAEFRVRFDEYKSQREFEESGAVEDLMRRMREQELVYKQEGAVWMKVSEYGDEKDRVVVRSNGLYTYRTPDIAYLENKYNRGFDRAIMMVGPDHHGHLITMQAAMKALGHEQQEFDGLTVQFCSLWRGAEKLKMSTRAGQFVTLREVFDEAGVDATRYFFTARKTDSPLEFDLELAKARSMDNPVYYVQYMSARLSGVLETAALEERFASVMRDGLFAQAPDLAPLEAEEEPILRHLMGLPLLVERAADNLDPQRLCAYLYDLAGLFHNYYTKNRFVSDDTALSRARLYFASALKVLLRELLALVGVSAPDKM